MENFLRKKAVWLALFTLGFLTPSVDAKENQEGTSKIQPIVVQKILDEAKKNTNWKIPVATGEHEQIVFMNISPLTNPDNEIGEETHSFDQAILIVEGKGELVVNGKKTLVSSGDMIFIPEGTEHNVINLDSKMPLKLMSFYSDTDMPKDAVYKKKTDQPKERED